MPPIPHTLFLFDQIEILAGELLLLVLTFLFQRRAALWCQQAKTWALVAKHQAAAQMNAVLQLQADSLLDMARLLKAEALQARRYAAGEPPGSPLATIARARAEELEALAEQMKQQRRTSLSQLDAPDDASSHAPSAPGQAPPA